MQTSKAHNFSIEKGLFPFSMLCFRWINALTNVYQREFASAFSYRTPFTYCLSPNRLTSNYTHFLNWLPWFSPSQCCCLVRLRVLLAISRHTVQGMVIIPCKTLVGCSNPRIDIYATTNMIPIAHCTNQLFFNEQKKAPVKRQGLCFVRYMLESCKLNISTRPRQ